MDALRPGYRQVAAGLRQQILSGELPPGSAIDAYSVLAARHKVSQATISAAVNQLADEGLVGIEHGKPTVVLQRRRWHVSVTVRQHGDPGIPPAVLDSARAALAAAAAGADPAVAELSAEYVLIPSTHDTPGWPALVTEMTVLAADVAIATGRAWGLVRDALRGHAGWDLDEPWASARPA